MLTKQEFEEIIKRANKYRGEELDWNQVTDVLLGVPCWKNDDELLDRIVEICNAAIKSQSSCKPTADELYLKILEAKYKCMAWIRSKDVCTSADMYDECLADFDGAISHYKELVERSGNAN